MQHCAAFHRRHLKSGILPKVLPSAAKSGIRLDAAFVQSAALHNDLIVHDEIVGAAAFGDLL